MVTARIGARVVRCRAPECDNVLNRTNVSGVCQDHSHSAWCECKYCLRKKGLGPSTLHHRESRPDVKQVRIPVTSPMNSTTQNQCVVISMPRAPWEYGHDQL
jgi:hypothetical protein